VRPNKTGEAMETLLDITQIQAILPHRYPFLLVDRIVDYEPGKRVVGVKNVTLNEPFFAGHFPGAPVMPGVLIVEAMAQTAGVMMLASLPDRETKLVFFTGIDGAKFRRPVVPGDQLRLELTVLRLRPRYIKLRGEAYVDEQLVAEAEISSALVDRSIVARSDQISSAAFTPVEQV
jgi:beta-hydroxyacyl-ACP dehydratase FabZ